MCMSLFEFAYLGFEEEWDVLFIAWGFYFSMCWLFLSVQYFDVFIDVHILPWPEGFYTKATNLKHILNGVFNALLQIQKRLAMPGKKSVFEFIK